MISDAGRRATFRAGAVLAGAVLALATGALVLGPRMLGDLRHDAVWYRYGAPLALRSRADRWYPLSMPVLLRWLAEDDGVRSEFARESLARFGRVAAPAVRAAPAPDRDPALLSAAGPPGPLERRGDRAGAIAALSAALQRPAGASDHRRQWRRLLYLLDVGTSEADLDAFRAQHPADPAAGLAGYARAVRLARRQEFFPALQLAFATDLERSLRALAAAVPGGAPFDSDAILALYHDQQKRWRSMGDLTPYGIAAAHPELRELAVARWASAEGWELPYLALYGGVRMGGVAPPGSLEPQVLAGNFRRANHLAQALELTWPLVDPAVSPWLREHNRYRQVALLYRLARQFPDAETLAMHPLPAFAPAGEPGRAWYAHAAGAASTQLIADYPHSGLAASALLCWYELSADTTKLTELLRRYPDGDRSEEARAALAAARRFAPGG